MTNIMTNNTTNMYENKTYQEQLYLMYTQHADYATLIDVIDYNYQHNYIDNDFLYIFERADNPKKVNFYSLSLIYLTEEEFKIALQGKFHCSVKLSTQLGLIDVNAKPNPYYQSEIEVLDNRITLPKDMYIGDIDEILFLDTLHYCKIKCKQETKFYKLYINDAHPQLNQFILVS